MKQASEVETRADFSIVRYAQCWEDADVLLDGLNIRPGDVCISVASGGDNSFAMLAKKPSRVIAIDLSPAQIYCVELRAAAFRELEHDELLELVGSRPSAQRDALYRRCRNDLSDDARRFWDAHPQEINAGIGSAGKFERYFATFREKILPLVHNRERVERLLAGGNREAREKFYNKGWDTFRWRLMYRIFFSRFVLGHMGRDPSFFKYVEGSVSDRLLARTRHALTALNPADNPYLQWILTGRHTTALPYYLRPENFDAIRSNLDALEWRVAPIEVALETVNCKIDRYNLSDVFEYMSVDNYYKLLERLIAAGKPGTRLAYWNMLAARACPPQFADRLAPVDDLGARLLACDKAFFYTNFVVEEVQ